MSTDDKDLTKDQTSKTPEAGDQGLISLEELDKVISEDDPEFKQQMDAVGSSANVGDLNIELIDLDKLLAEEQEKSLKARLARIRRRARILFVKIKEALFYFVKNDIPAALKAIASFFKKRIESLRSFVGRFKTQSKKQKILTLSFIALCLGVGFVFFKILTRGLIPKREPLLIQSLENYGSKTLNFDDDEAMEPFYSSVRVAQNIVLLPKLVVNLKRSSNSGRNPMGAAEVYLEGMSSDVVIEIKDRESEFRDHLMRIMEGFSYDDLTTPEGKVRLQELLVREVNTHSTKGKIRKAYFKSIVLKP